MHKRLLPLVMAIACATSSIAFAQQIPNSQSRLYYRIGGGDPASHAPNPKAISLKLGLGGTVKLNYSCGKFDAGVSFQNLMSGFSQLGVAISGAIRAGIASLPMYIFQRAQPGLYELFQTYAKKAEIAIAASLKTCEEMEAQIKAGADPYENWIKLSKVESWKNEAATGTDVVTSKSNVETSNGRDGLTWIGGVKAAGFAQKPIQVLKDLAVAGYNVTMNQPVLSPESTVYQSNGPLSTKLARTFPRPVDAATFATDVLGDLQIATCTEVSCPTKGSSTGLGLLPKFDAEQLPSQQQMDALLVSGTPNYVALTAASAPGVSITPELVTALKEMPPIDQNIVSSRLAREVALARTIDRALTVRNLILTGMTLPETQIPSAQDEARKRLDLLNRHIDDLMFESRVRKEMVSSTAEAVLDSYRSSRAVSASIGRQPNADQNPMSNGRVK